MLRNRSSGPEAGIPVRFKKNTSAGRFWWLPSSSPSKIRPGTPASGREALLRNIKYRSLAQGRPRGFEFKRAPYDVLTFGPSPMGPIGGPHKHTSTGCFPCVI